MRRPGFPYLRITPVSWAQVVRLSRRLG